VGFPLTGIPAIAALCFPPFRQVFCWKSPDSFPLSGKKVAELGVFLLLRHRFSFWAFFWYNGFLFFFLFSAGRGSLCSPPGWLDPFSFWLMEELRL